MFIVLVLLSLTGSVVFLIKTQYGIGINPDSVVYIDTARHLSQGLGFVYVSKESGLLAALEHFPPGYSILLAFFGSLGLDLLNAAKWLNAFIFSANILLVGFSIYKYTRSFGMPILGALLMLTSTDSWTVHLRAMSDPLFIFLTLSGLLLVARYLEKPGRMRLVAAAVVVASAALTRYAGISVIITGMAGLIFLSPRRETYRAKFFDALVFGAISAFPLALWILRTVVLSQHIAGHKAIFHPMDPEELKKGIFLIPAGILILGAVIYRKKLFRRTVFEGCYRQMPALWGIFIIIYAVCFVITRVFFNAAIVFHYRLLFPIHVAGIILVLCLIYDMLYAAKRIPIIKALSVILGIMTGVMSSLHGAMWMRSSSSENALRFTAKEWRESRIIERIKGLPSQTLIYSNGADVIYFYTGRKALAIPGKFYADNLLVKKDYSSSFYKMGGILKNRKGVLIYFTHIRRTYIPSKEELVRELPLEVVAEYPEGTIYQMAQ